jgi:hypothetical protein
MRSARGKAYRRAGAVLAALGAWSAAVEAAPDDVRSVATDRGDTKESTKSAAPRSLLPPFLALPALDAATDPSPPLSRSQLNYPNHRAPVFEHRRLYAPPLRVMMPIYGSAPDASLKTGTDRRQRHSSADWASLKDQRVDLKCPANGNPIAPAYFSTDLSSTPAEDDERSAWAKWNGTLVGVSGTVLTFMAAMVAAFTLLPPDVTGWSEPDFKALKGNFTQGPRFDNDHTYFNYIAHPIDGSEFYLMARNRGASWWQGLAYSAALSTIFECFVESAYERASWQDLWITPVSGAVIGELRWQVKKSLENPSTGKPVGTMNKILYVVIDPFDAVFKL